MKRNGSNQIHPTAIIGENVTLGAGTVVGPQAIIYDNVTIGESSHVGPRVTIGEPGPQYYQSDDYVIPPTVIGAHSIIRSGTVIYHGCQLGDYFQTGHYASIRENTICGHHCSFGIHASSDGDCEIGSYVRAHYHTFICKRSVIKDFVWIFPHAVLTEDPHPPSDTCSQGPTLEAYAIISANAVILPGVHIGEGSLIGAGSVVTKDVPPEGLAMGVPAKVVGSVRDIRCKEGRLDQPYPWREHFKRGMPWGP